MKLQDQFPSQYVEIKSFAATRLSGFDEIEHDEIHYELFNSDYYIIGTYQAKQWLGDKAFDAIRVVQEYEQDNFGEVSTDLSDPEKVVNMLAYIIGECVLAESETYQELHNSTVEKADLEKIIAELES